MAQKTDPDLALAALLIGLAGFVDAIGYLRLGGLFVSFMSGNSTELAIAAAAGDAGQVAKVGAVVAAFVVGAFAGAVAGRLWPGWHRPLTLWLVCGLLLVGALAPRSGVVAFLPVAAAMGLQNAVLHKAEGQSVGLTYVTGALVHFAEGLAAAVFKPGWTWAPHALMWIAMIAGAAVGAAVFVRIGPAALLVAGAVAAAVALAVTANLLPRSGAASA